MNDRRREKIEEKFAQSYIFLFNSRLFESQMKHHHQLFVSPTSRIYTQRALWWFSEWHCTIIVHVVIMLNIATKASSWSQSANKWAIYVNDSMLNGWRATSNEQKKCEVNNRKKKMMWCLQYSTSIGKKERGGKVNDIFSHVKIYSRNGWKVNFSERIYTKRHSTWQRTTTFEFFVFLFVRYCHMSSMQQHQFHVDMTLLSLEL